MGVSNAFSARMHRWTYRFSIIALTLLVTACGSDHDLNVAQSVGGTILSDDGFINCGDSCIHTYSANTEVALTAIPEGENLFMNWTGGCSGIEATCSLTITNATSVGASFSSPEDPDIGTTFSTVAGSTISLRFTGSTDYWDRIGLFEPTDTDNTSPLVNVRVGVGPGVSSLRVPTDIPPEGKSLQLRMYNNQNETIVIDDNIFIADYDASMSFATTSMTPEGTITISYDGSTNYWDKIAAFPIGAPNSEQIVSTRIGSNPSGEVEFTVPWYEGEFEVRMLNDNGETIVVGPNITLAYGPASVSSNRIINPGSSFSVSYTGTTDYWDSVALFAQEITSHAVSSRTGAGNGNTNLSAPTTTGLYDLRLVNNHDYTIVNGERVAILLENQREIFSAPEIAAPGELLEIAYSGSGTGEGQHWVGIFEQGALNENYLSRMDIGSTSVGFAELTAPALSGIYELRLVDGNNTTLAVGNFVSIVDSSETATYIQDNVVAGETVRVVFTGTTDYWDYVEIYEIGGDGSPVVRGRIGSAGDANYIDLRVPTMPGDYEIRVVNDGEVLATGNQFSVAPYSASLTLSTDTARPQEYITVTYSGLNNYWDRIAFFVPGAPNDSPVQSARLGSQFAGEASVQVPGSEGVYEVRLINDKDELILDGGTITLSYDATGVNAAAIVLPGALLDISYSGSTDYWDRVGLYAQDATTAGVSKNTQGVESGILQVTAPSVTGVYNLKLVNSEDVLIAEGNTVSVLDPTTTAVFAGHATATPSETVTVAYSGSTGTEATPDRVGIFVQGSDNSSPLGFAVLPEGSVGAASLVAPASDGIYEVRLYNHLNETIVSSEDYLRVVDSTVDSIHVPATVVAGSTHKVIFSGATDYWDSVAIYNATETDPANFLYKVRVGLGSGIHDVRVPTLAGEYTVRLINQSNGLIVDGNDFIVQSYATTLSLASVATPAASIPVEYTGTTNYWDRVAIYQSGETGLNYLTSTRIPPEGTVAHLPVPTTEGTYDVKAVNDKGEIIVEAGTITLTYDAITISGPEFAMPAEEIEVTYDGSTQYWDKAQLVRDDVSSKAVVESLRIGSQAAATVMMDVPQQTGLYQLDMINNGGVLMAGGGTVAVLDPAEVAVFASPRLLAPGETVTLAYSGSATTSNSVGIFEDGGDNSSPIISTLTTGSEGKEILAAPTAAGVYDVRLVNAVSDTLAEASKLYVLDSSVSGVHSPNVVRAGETIPIIYSGSTDYWDKVAFFPIGSLTTSDNAVSPQRIGSSPSGAVNIRVPTIEGQYELRLTNGAYSVVIAAGTEVTVLPYDGSVEPE